MRRRGNARCGRSSAARASCSRARTDATHSTIWRRIRSRRATRSTPSRRSPQGSRASSRRSARRSRVASRASWATAWASCRPSSVKDWKLSATWKNVTKPAPSTDARRLRAVPRASGPLTRRAVWLLALLFVACSRNPSEPNLVFITLDTTRADHLGLYGYFRETSPALDAFAKQAIVFERNLSPMATTLPTHTTLFTATQPLEHGVLANGTHDGSRFVPTPQLRLLAELARSGGWRTGAFVSAAPLKKGSGIETGFEH